MCLHKGPWDNKRTPFLSYNIGKITAVMHAICSTRLEDDGQQSSCEHDDAFAGLSDALP